MEFAFQDDISNGKDEVLPSESFVWYWNEGIDMEGKTSLWTIPSGIVRIDMQPRPGLSNFQGARDLFRDKKFVLEYARSTCAIQSRRGHLLRDTPPRTKSELSRRTFGRRDEDARITFDQNYFDRVSLPKVDGKSPSSPLSIQPFNSIYNSEWILPKEIHILLL